MLHSGDGQCCGLEIDLGPLQVANLGSPQAMPECQQDHGLIPVRPTGVFTPPISCSTSRSVRYSRVLTSPFLGRRGVTFRISALGGTTRRAVFVIDCRAFAATTFRI